MAKGNIFRKLAGAGLLAAGAAGAYVYFVRPWMMRWGASEDELHKPLPGDELVPHPQWSFTQAVTIHVEPDEVWPWLVQWGYGRGGFYSYDWMDRLLGASGVVSANSILPQFQKLEAGDRLPVEPGGNGFLVERVEPNCYLLLSNRLDLRTGKSFGIDDPRPAEYMNFSWLWYLESQGGCRTRLISRSRADLRLGEWKPANLMMGEPLKPGSAIMDWGMLNGIKRRAEEAGCTPNDQ